MAKAKDPVTDVQKRAGKASKDALAVMVAVMKSKKASAATRVKAASHVLDRATGRPGVQVPPPSDPAMMAAASLANDGRAMFNVARRIAHILAKGMEYAETLEDETPLLEAPQADPEVQPVEGT